MKKIIILTIVVLSVLILFSGCSNTLTASIVEAENPDQIKVSLEENPTTGYQWTYKISDESLIKYVSDSYNDSSSSNTVGAGGVHDFIFKAIADGKADITFTYERSFEKDSAETVLVYKYDIANKVPALVDIDEEGK